MQRRTDVHDRVYHVATEPAARRAEHHHLPQVINIILLLLIILIITITTYLSHLLSSSPSLDLVHAQYVFIHDVLAEALIVGNTSVVKHNLPCYVRSLESSESGSEGFPSWKVLEKQFTLATELHPPSHQYLTAVNPVNQVHNNSMDYVAVDLTRVVLQPMVGGTDYINSSWVPGYSRSDQYILSQV